jgi:peptidoglycan/xylan/chitin deacetylase (PgdA/CDA1 family)
MARRAIRPAGDPDRPLHAMNRVLSPASLRLLAKRALRVSAVGEVVRTIAAARGRSLVLVYHRVPAGEPADPEVVPSVPRGLFQRQLEALAEVGDIEPLDVVLHDRDRHARPMFALTFDDDYLTHVEQALPVLQALALPATFFLSGRALHGLGSYWFEVLERLVAVGSVDRVSRVLHLRGGGLDALITACESDPSLQRIVEAEGSEAPLHLDRSNIQALSNAGMSVGFHTLHHEILTHLGDDELDAALTVGRGTLERITGRPLSHFAYPHGKADARTAGKVRDAGYEAAWTGRPQPVHRRDDRYLLGRWEPGRLDVDDFLVGAAIRLTRGSPW